MKSSVPTHVLIFAFKDRRRYRLNAGIKPVSALGGRSVRLKLAFAQGGSRLSRLEEGRWRARGKVHPRLWVQQNQPSGCAPTSPLAVRLSGHGTQMTS